jgi:predicted Zn finger-like uncharacterized protein
MKYTTLLITLLSTLSPCVSGFSVNPITHRGTPSSLFSSPPEAASTEASAAAPAPAAPSTEVAASAAAPTEADKPAVPATGTAAPPAAAAAPVNNQPKYGKELDLPGTYVRCGRCATSYAIAASDLGTGKGRRVECALCGHSWFQTPDRLFNLNDGHELIPLPEPEIKRIGMNVEAGRDPDFIGNAKYYVGNLDFGVTENDLRELFGGIGPVGGVSIVMGPDGRSRGFAFVTMMNDDDQTTEMCMNLDQHELNGRSINVKPPNN